MMEDTEKQELVELIINYKGNDFNVCVAPQTAEMLLNGIYILKANNYIKKYCLESEEEDTMEFNDVTPSTTSSSNNNVTLQSLIWSSKSKKTEDDHAATLLLLKEREKYANKFDDKKTSKAALWHKIANEIKLAGFSVGEGGAEKCRQKFMNLQKQHIKHIKHMKETGSQKKNPPPYFEEMHSSLGDKDKVDPKILEDTLSENESTDVEIKKEAIINRFCNTKVSNKPKSGNTLILEHMAQENKFDRMDRERHFSTLENLLTTQNKQREQMINLLTEVVKSNRKRRRQQSEEDE